MEVKSAIETFGEWALNGKDEEMAQGHRGAVEAMLDYALRKQKTPFTAIDAGCGNGWVARMLRKNLNCIHALGIDAAKEMIDRAFQIDPEGDYVLSDLRDWRPSLRVDLVHSMEVLYYFREPEILIKHIVENWLNSGGRFIMGIDHYIENTSSLDWAEKHNIEFMATLSKEDWQQFFRDAGLSEIESWQVGAKDEWSGTLIVTGRKI